MFKEQIAAFDKFSKLKVGALFMEMGTGKTRVALELVNYNNVDYLLYFTPFSTTNNIIAEIDKWGVNCDYDVIGFESISASDKLYLELLEKIEGKRCFIIADESIFIKNSDTKRYFRLMKIREQCEYALILNGTPISKSEWDIYNQFNFLSYDIFKMSENQFRSTFFDTIRYKKRYEKPHEFTKFSKVNAEAFQQIIEPYVFRSMLNLDIDESISEKSVAIDLTEYNYEKEDGLADMASHMTLEKILALLTKLNVIASTSEDKNKEVAEYIKGKQVIVYCNYIKEVEQLRNLVDCYVITGSTKKPKRTTIIEEFKNDSKPLIMTFGVGSYSLNLQFCNEIVYSSLNFDFAKIEQSKFRIKRIGQEREIRYTYFLAECGINNMISTNLKQKKDMGNLIKENIQKGTIDKWLKNI